jgi:hypothetical protein
MEAIFSRCTDFPGRAGFAEFARRRSYRSQAYYVAFKDETAQSIKFKAETRRTLEEVGGGNDREAVVELIQRLSGGAGSPSPIEQLRRRIIAPLKRTADNVNVAFWHAVMRVAKIYGGLIVSNRPRSVSADLGQTLDVELDLAYQHVETGQIQNQMTNISWVRPGRWPLLRLSLLVVDLLAKHAFRPGDFAGVKTVHYARWSLIDDGKGLLFEGNFDGTWENYMGDFADRIAWGLDSVWGNTEGYPKAGMRDIWAFKRYIRDLQFPAAMAYMAYPDVAVSNTVRDRAIAEAIDASGPGTVDAVLAAL